MQPKASTYDDNTDLEGTIGWSEILAKTSKHDDSQRSNGDGTSTSDTDNFGSRSSIDGINSHRDRSLKEQQVEATLCFDELE